MAFKPSDFAIGVLDFFSVLLPGAILTAFLAPSQAVRKGLTVAMPLQDGTAKWVAFGLASYLVGHIVFMMGAALDPVYDRWRRWRHPREEDLLYERAAGIRDQALGLGGGASQRPSRRHPVNVFQWARTICMLRSTTAAQEIQRLEADSKFFRSLVIVLPVLAVLLFAKGLHALGAGLLVLTVACFARYAGRRWKSTEVAYQYLLAFPHVGVESTEHRRPRPAAAKIPERLP